MHPILDYTRKDSGCVFTLTIADTALPPQQWLRQDGLVNRTGRPARAGSILSAWEDEIAREDRENSLWIPDAFIAGLDPVELENLGLPPPSAATIQIKSEKLLTDSEFAPVINWLRPDGRPMQGVIRDGCFIDASGDRRTLPFAVFELVEAIENFQELPSGTLEERLRAWSGVAEKLPPDSFTDDTLQSVRVVAPTSFTLDLFENNDGEIDFDVILGNKTLEQIDESDEPTSVFNRSLPDARQDEFSKRFRRLGKVRSRHPVGNNWFVILPDQIEKALGVAKNKQSASRTEREEFARNPSVFIQEALDPNREDPDVEEIFADEGYGDRVRGVGLWREKVIPWIERPAQPWFPPIVRGIRIGDKYLELDHERAQKALVELREAEKNGESSIHIGGTEVPVNEGTRKALEGIPAPPTHSEPPAEPGEESEKPISERQTLDVIDNLDEVDFITARAQASPAPLKIPKILKSTLLEHQKSGLHWLQSLFHARASGALLADDMGLGKTITALAFLASQREEADAQASRAPCLIVAPTGLLRNWRDEHDKHLYSPGLGELGVAYGSSLKKLRKTSGNFKELDRGIPSLDIPKLRNLDWVLTSYETLRDYQHSFGRIHWGTIVYDEMQKIKSPAAAVTDAAKAMTCDFSIGLTGTPVENRLADLWCLADTLQPGHLGSLKEFSPRYESLDPSESQSKLVELRESIAGGKFPRLMLRRFKDDHLEALPSKEIITHKVKMPAIQADAYDKAVRERGSGKGATLKALQAVRNFSLHPHNRQSTEDDQTYINASARLVATFRILDEIAQAGEKVLIFLESREMQSNLMELLQRRYELGAPPLLINGTVDGDRRKARVDDFQTRRGFDVMLLSPRAGGVGLTLTAANHVIHLTRWWNPAVEDQCTDRAYRIGQTKDVSVHLPLAIHPLLGEKSFDCNLDALLGRKRLLSRSVLAPVTASSADIETLAEDTFQSP